VSINKLGKRLRRELKANPKKAAVLGLLVIGALCFWAPLLRSWISPGKATSAAGKSSPAVVPVAGTLATPTADGAAENKRPSHSWEQIVALIERDPRTRAATKLPGRPDPFHEVVSKEEEQQAAAEKEAKEAKTAEAPLDPQGLGMVLSSTIIGPNRRVALINGKAYPEGGQVVLGGSEHPTEFRLTRVHPKGVVLERDGKLFEVNLPDRKSSGRMEVLAGQN
jgi:hypothetical protein